MVSHGSAVAVESRVWTTEGRLVWRRQPLHVYLASELRTGPLQAPHYLLSLTVTVK